MRPSGSARRRLAAACAVLATLLATVAVPCGAQPEPGGDGAASAKPGGILPVREYGGDLRARSYLAGDWGGARTALAERGIAIDLSFTQTFQAIVDGGRRETEEYGGKFETYTSLDLDRMGFVPGALVTMRTESRFGSSVNGDAGTILPVNDVMYFPLTDEIDDDIPITISELRYTQFLSPEIGVFVGKFTTLGGDFNEFAAGRGDTEFLNHAFLSASVTALTNPYSTLGGGLIWMPTERIALSSTIYQSTDSSMTTGFDNFDQGWTSTTAARGQYLIAGLPGGVMGSFAYAFDNSFVDFSEGFVDSGRSIAIPRSSDSWAVYFNAWQYLFVEEASDQPVDVTNGRIDRQGVGLFARGATADQDTNPVKWIVSGGISGRGVIPGRDRDTFGVGYAYNELREARFVSTILLDTAASRFEAYYDLAITPAAAWTFDVQYTDSLLKRLDPAVILGMRLRLQF